MGKRLIRIYEKDISTKAAALQGIELNIILKNKSSFHGIVTASDKEGISMKDMLSRKHYFKFSAITEIVYDQEAAY